MWYVSSCTSKSARTWPKSQRACVPRLDNLPRTIASCREVPKLPICTSFLPRRGPRSLLWWRSGKHHKQCEEWSQEPRSGWRQRELLEVLYRSGPTTTEGIEGFTAKSRQDQKWLRGVSLDILDTVVVLGVGSRGEGAITFSAFARRPFSSASWAVASLLPHAGSHFLLPWLKRPASIYRFLFLWDVLLNFLGS